MNMKEYPLINIKSTRAGFGDALLEVGHRNSNVVALSADLSDSVKMTKFIEAFPDRFFQVGIAEANMIGIAAGLATCGKIPFTGSFANFSSGRVYDQIRQSVAYSNKNVKICASHAGLTLGEDGATHQILEDIGLMKMLPNMTVINPCDYNQTMQAVFAIAEFNGPVYLRFGRPDVPNFIPPSTPFEIGKGIILNEGTDVSIFATGHMVWKALLACKILEEKGISAEIINIHTIKPLDKKLILQSVRKTGCALSVEEHQKAGGMGESIAAILAAEYPVFMEIMGVNDVFGESGKPEELLQKFGLTENHIVQNVLLLLGKKVIKL